MVDYKKTETILVTGATGHLGNVTVRKLVEQGYNVKILVRKTSPMDGLEDLMIEKCYGDVNNIQSLKTALTDCNYCIHMAAVVDIGRTKKQQMKKVNVEGTKNICLCCKEFGIKLIYISTSHVIECGFNNEEKTKLVETTHFDKTLAKDDYARTKLEATEYVISETTKGLKAIILYPSAIIGPFSYRISNTHQMILEYMRGKLFAKIKGSYNFVDVRDVADAIVSSLKKGKCGEGYLLTGEKLTVDELFSHLKQITHISKPKLTIPLFLARLVAPLCELFYAVRKKRPLFSRTCVKTLQGNSNFSSEKAKHSLDFSTTNIHKSIEDSVSFALENKQAVINQKKSRR